MKPRSGFLDEAALGAVTDLYQITMAAAMHEDGSADESATYNLVVRTLPPGRPYLIAAGLEQAVHYLETVSFSGADLDFLRAQAVFRESTVRPAFWERLRAFRFRGELRAVPEGTAVFENEPILSVTGPRLGAQLVETYLLSVVNFQTLIATKAALIVEAAAGRPVIEFGQRRAQGPAAGVLASRAAYVGGCAGTSNVYAARLFGIPVSGTMAHAYVMSKAREQEAFERYAAAFPSHTIALVDTYDPARGTQRAIAAVGPKLKGVRTDSGTMEEMAADCKRIRRLLDEAGCRDTKIVVSNDLNERKIRVLLGAGAPIDAFGVGTDLVTSRDVPALGGVYKLVEDVHGPKIKLSPGKVTLPGRQQVWRQAGRDVIALEDERPGGEPLLATVMKGGDRVAPLEELAAIRDRAIRERERLRAGRPAVETSPGLAALMAGLREKLGKETP